MALTRVGKNKKKKKVHSIFISQVHSQPYGHKLEAASSDNWNGITFWILQKPLCCMMYVEREIHTSVEGRVRYLINDNKFLPETPVSLLYLIPSNNRRSFISWPHVHPEEVLLSRLTLTRQTGFFVEINHVDEDTDTVLSESGRTCSCAASANGGGRVP